MKTVFARNPSVRILHSTTLWFTALCGAASSQVPLMNLVSSTGDDDFGADVTLVGDVDGDGVPDFAIGVPRTVGPTGATAGGPGAVRVISGATGSLLFVGNGLHANDFFGSAVAGGGDVDADGFPDLVAGGFLMTNGPSAAGGIRVFSVANGTVLFTRFGDSANDWLGFAVADAGDVDSDGHADVACGAPYDDNATTDSGSVRVYSGSNGSVLYTLNGSFPQGGFGRALDGIGDATGDGVDDLAVGVPYATVLKPQSGQLRIYSGASGGQHLALSGVANLESFGSSVSRAGDLDGDGRGEVLVGTSANAVRIHSGSDGAQIMAFSAGTPGDLAGTVAAMAHDFNGDGVADVIVGAPRSNLNGTESGAAFVVSGQNGSVLETLRGTGAFAHFGSSVAGIEDVDSDGRADVLVGAPDGGIAGFGFGGVAQVFVGLPAGCVNGPGSVDLNVDGVPDPCQFCQSNLAAGGPGNLHLQICGDSLTFTGSVATLGLSKGTPGGPLFLLASTSSHPTPLLGGTVWPFPVIAMITGNFDAEGKWRLKIPGGPAPTVNVYLQAIAPWPGGTSPYEISGPTLLKLGY